MPVKLTIGSIQNTCSVFRLISNMYPGENVGKNMLDLLITSDSLVTFVLQFSVPLVNYCGLTNIIFP